MTLSLCQDGVVRLMGNHLIIPGGTRAIDATGKFIMPGGIDMNVHLQRPGYGTQTIDDFYQVRKTLYHAVSDLSLRNF